jgi:Flp pilus assembly protein TadG
MSLSPEDYAMIRNFCILTVLATAGLAGLTVLACRCCFRLWSLRRFHRAERGAAYTITMVATMPIYALLVCVIIECVLALQVKIGTVYAAYAAARSAAVYLPLRGSQSVREEKVKLAAVQALAPFASSREKHLCGISAGGGDGAPTDADTNLYAAYAAYCPGGPIGLECLHNKLEYAWRATDVTVTPSSDKADANYAVIVRYKMPYHTAVGYLLGGRAEGGLCLLDIESTVTLPKEGVRSLNQTLGIHYDPNHD